MSLMEHLYELRQRLFYAVLGIGIGTVIGFIWFGHGIPAIGLPSLSDILTGPYCAVPASERVTFGTGDDCKLLATGPFSALELQLKSALIAGVVLSSPVWLYQLWAFVTPALYSKERRYAITFVSCGGVLFVLGALLAYVVIREGLTVLLGLRRRRDHRRALPGQLLLVPDRHVDHLRGLLRTPAAADHAEPDRRDLQRETVAVAALFDLRHGGLRRPGGARQRPGHHAGAGGRADPAVRAVRSGHQGARQAVGQAVERWPSCPTTRHRRCPTSAPPTPPMSSVGCSRWPRRRRYPNRERPGRPDRGRSSAILATPPDRSPAAGSGVPSRSDDAGVAAQRCDGPIRCRRRAATVQPRSIPQGAADTCPCRRSRPSQRRRPSRQGRRCADSDATGQPCRVDAGRRSVRSGAVALRPEHHPGTGPGAGPARPDDGLAVHLLPRRRQDHGR